MRSLTATELLNIWERGLTQLPVQRALLLLAAGCDMPTDTLAQLSLGQRDARLLTLREWAFGSQVVGMANCPRCSERLEMTFNVAEIRGTSGLPNSNEVRTGDETFAFNLADYAVRFRLPNSSDLSAAAEHANVAARGRLVFERCVLSAQRDNTAVAIPELPDDLIAAVILQMAEADPQAEVRIALTCPVCAHCWQAMFDILSFFWQEIDDWARRILRDVHTLASVYGWRESDILALGAHRRQLYLEMVG